jgi:hypothetical protein
MADSTDFPASLYGNLAIPLALHIIPRPFTPWNTQFMVHSAKCVTMSPVARIRLVMAHLVECAVNGLFSSSNWALALPISAGH